MKKIIAGVTAALAAFALVGCSASSASSQSTSDSHATARNQSSSSTPSPSVPVNGIGSTVTNGTITLQLIAAAEQPTIPYDTGGEGTTTYTYAPKAPDAGTKWWVATVNVLNNGKQSIDVTCSLPITIKAINSAEQEYDPIQSLYQVQGNPECNKGLQPGMSEQTTFPFSVPTNAKMIGLAWYDSTDLNATANVQPSIFTTDPNYKLSVK